MLKQREWTQCLKVSKVWFCVLLRTVFFLITTFPINSLLFHCASVAAELLLQIHFFVVIWILTRISSLACDTHFYFSLAQWPRFCIVCKLLRALGVPHYVLVTLYQQPRRRTFFANPWVRIQSLCISDNIAEFDNWLYGRVCIPMLNCGGRWKYDHVHDAGCCCSCFRTLGQHVEQRRYRGPSGCAPKYVFGDLRGWPWKLFALLLEFRNAGGSRCVAAQCYIWRVSVLFIFAVLLLEYYAICMFRCVVVPNSEHHQSSRA